MNEKLDLIRKLLAKAESTNYPAEAETFQAHAERLMIRYGIEQAQLDSGKDESQIDMIREHIDFTGIYAQAFQLGLSQTVIAYKTCHVVISGAGNHRRMYIIGAKSDVEQMVQMVHSLKVQAEIALKVWWKTYTERMFLTGSAAWRTRRQFMMSFGYGAADRVSEMLREEAPVGSSTDLVLVDRQDQAKRAAEDMFDDLKVNRTRLAGGTESAASAGRQAGREANINQKGVGTSPRQSITI